MSVMMLTGDEGNVYHMDSLAFPAGTCLAWPRQPGAFR